MTITVPKPEVLQAAFANIQANLVYWNQIAWVGRWTDRDRLPPENACGTTACLAGHILLSQGITWKDLGQFHVSTKAMELLGYVEEWKHCDDPYCDDLGHLAWSGDGDDFAEIFYAMESDDDVSYEYTQEAFDKFKAHVTELTGVDL